MHRREMVTVAVVVLMLSLVCAISMYFAENAASSKTCSRPVLLPHFLSDEECAQAIAAGTEAGMHRSEVLSSADKVSNTRTSSTVFLERDSPISQVIFDKVRALTGAPFENMERVQILRYLPGQQYKEHFDSCKACDNGKDVLRTETVFCYLNEVEAGGETNFPKVGMRVIPQKGLAVHWKNIDENNNPLPCSLHAGMPVKTGVKWAANVWIRRGAAN